MSRLLNPYSSSRTLRRLARRILDISHRNHLGHIGSCLTALPILYDIYQTKRPDDKVILSAGHSGLALLVTLEHFGLIPDAEVRLLADGIHPVRGPGVDVSTGSLGQGITVGVGMALARPDIDVHVVSTDGEVSEGSWWESLYFIWRRRLPNIHVYLNDNGYSALDATFGLDVVLKPFPVQIVKTSSYVPDLPWFTGLKQHYQVMNADQYVELAAHYAD